MPQSHGNRRRPKKSSSFARGGRGEQARADAPQHELPHDAQAPGDPNGTGAPYGADVPYAAGDPFADGAQAPGAPYPSEYPSDVPHEAAPPPGAGAPPGPGAPDAPPGRTSSALQAAGRFTPNRGTVLRVLTSNVTITAVGLAVLAAVLVLVPIGGGEDDSEPPAIAAEGMSANEMLEIMRGSAMDPVAADAVATAKKRAYEKQQALAKQEKAEKNSDESVKSSFDKPEPETPSGGGGAIPDAPAGGGDTSVSQNKAMGQRMNALKGWSGCWSALESLWTKESGWNERAQNPSSGAYGIPQSLPGSKMASAGSDWQTNAATQIAWGLSYIDARYGTPCEAWGHSQSVGWY